jgi:hypothetical protein
MMIGFIGAMAMVVKTMNNLFNSTFEMELRILLLLSKVSEPCSSDRILAYDFIACYSADFQIGDVNLHGINSFKYGEIASRKELVTEAIKALVIKGLIMVDVKDGYYFRIADSGLDYINRFESSYALEYSKSMSFVIDDYGDKNDSELMKLIQKYSIVLEG